MKNISKDIKEEMDEFFFNIFDHVATSVKTDITEHTKARVGKQWYGMIILQQQRSGLRQNLI